MSETDFQAAEDGLYQARMAGRAIKLKLNEYRESLLTNEELTALFDAETESE